MGDPPAPTADSARPAAAVPAAETVRLYATDWAGFTAWCQASGCAALPAAPATVAAFLAATAATLSGGARGRRAAAIAYHHRAAGLDSPTADPAVTALVRAARRGATRHRPRPPHAAQLRRMAATCPGDLAGVRDRALLLLAAAGVSARAALVGLDAEHVRFTAGSVDLTVRTPGPDRDSLRRVTIPHGATLASCPVQALRRWLDLSDTRFGPVFRKIDRWGTIEHRRLGTDALRRIFFSRRRPRRGHPA